MNNLIKLFLSICALIFSINTGAQTNSNGYGYGSTPQNDKGNNNNGIPPPTVSPPTPPIPSTPSNVPTQPNVYQPAGTNQPNALDTAPQENIYHDYTGNDTIGTNGVHLSNDLNGLPVPDSSQRPKGIRSIPNKNDSLASPK